MRDPWDSLTAFCDTFTCYSSALATWVACAEQDWEAVVEPGLWLTVTEAPGKLLGFAHFPPDLRARLGLIATGADDQAAAVEGVLAELARSGRVIVAGDGFNLPWHVAFGRVHAPHWFVLVDGAGGLTMYDPFACRNELGVQAVAREPVTRDALAQLLRALPADDPVHQLRERLALGDAPGPLEEHRHRWFVRGEVAAGRAPEGADGPDAVERLARHFRDHGHEPDAYAQADDIWSIARHRAFLAHHAQQVAERRGSGELAAWVSEHAAPLAKRWAHMAPLLMQARLALQAGRSASSSVPETLEELAARERTAGADSPPQATWVASPASAVASAGAAAARRWGEAL